MEEKIHPTNFVLQVTDAVKALYALRKDEENVRKAALAIGKANIYFIVSSPDGHCIKVS